MNGMEKAFTTKDVARRIEGQQRDLTVTIRKLTELRRAGFSGRMVLRFEAGRITKYGLKPDKTGPNGEKPERKT